MNKPISKVYQLGEGRVLSIDQSYIGDDKTCLCFARYDGEAITILSTQFIEKQNDIDNYINRNMKEIYRAFGFTEGLL